MAKPESLDRNLLPEALSQRAVSKNRQVNRRYDARCVTDALPSTAVERWSDGVRLVASFSQEV